ncbi:lipopolysaccharide biosynthesis protein [Pseudomonadota bacterium]
MSNGSVQGRLFFVYAGQAAVTAILPLVTILVLTRYLTPEDFGIYALAQVYAIFMVGLCNFGLPMVINRNYFEYSDDPLKLSQLLYGVILFSLSLFVISLSITMMFEDTFLSFLGISGPPNLLVIAFCGQYLNVLSLYYMAYYINSEEAKKYAGCMIFFGIANTVAVLFLVVIMDVGVIGLAIAHCVGWGMLFVLLSFLFFRRLPYSFDWNILKHTLVLGLPLAPKEVVKVMSGQFDKYMLGLLGSTGGVGLYSIAQRIGSINNTFLTVLQNVYAPRLFKMMFDNENGVSEKIGTYLTPFVYLSICPPLLMILFSDYVVRLLLPAEYASVSELLIVFSLYYGFLFIGTVTTRQFLFKKNVGIIMALVVFTLIVNVSLSIPMIKIWGAIGAAWALFFGGVIVTAASFFAAQRYYRISWELGKMLFAYGVLSFSGVLEFGLLELEVAVAIKLFIELSFVAFFVFIVFWRGIISRSQITSMLSLVLKKRHAG